MTDKYRAFNFIHSDHQGSVVMVTDSAGQIEQHNSYYPYGEPHRAPEGQPMLYAGKERLAPTAEYDYGARRHFPPALLWYTPDAHADNYECVSPYSFCIGNPIQNVDSNGKDIFILNLGNTTNQHMGMLIQNDDDTWSYYSINGDNVYNSSGEHTGGRTFDDIGIGKWKNPHDFLNSEYNNRPNNNLGKMIKT